MKKHQEEKKKRREAGKKTEQARMSLEWKKKAEEILMKASKEWGKAGAKQGRVQNDPDMPDAKRRRIDDILKGIEAREKAALAKKDKEKGAGDPMDWDPEIF
jgi:hypothetical protein